MFRSLFFTLIFSVSLFGCSYIQNSSCDDLANTVRDASYFLCNVIRQNPNETAHMEDVIQGYITALQNSPPSTERNKLINRLQIAKANYQK